MAVITPVISNNANAPYPSNRIYILKASWTLANGDTGLPIGFAEFADRSVQIAGTFGTGGTATIQGSNDGGANWATLKDAFGNALTITAAGIYEITEIVELIRPNITAGDGSTALVATMFMRKMTN